MTAIKYITLLPHHLSYNYLIKFYLFSCSLPCLPYLTNNKKTHIWKQIVKFNVIFYNDFFFFFEFFLVLQYFFFQLLYSRSSCTFLKAINHVRQKVHKNEEQKKKCLEFYVYFFLVYIRILRCLFRVRKIYIAIHTQH